MSKLTTQQIIAAVDSERYSSWEWEEALETYTGQRPEDVANAISSARFLEQWMPGREWSVSDFSNLLGRIEGGRWSSAAECGATRAHEDHEDEKIDAARLAKVTATDEASAAYIRDGNPRTRVFTDDDGTVLVFGSLIHPDDLQAEWQE